jgi:polyhydroxyalkanoate synthesis regulator phasin
MKLPPRAKRCQEVIDQMVDWLNFYMGETREFKDFVRKDIKYLEEYLSEISEEHKIHNIRFASKLKGLWKLEIKEKEQEIKELKEQLEDKND